MKIFWRMPGSARRPFAGMSAMLLSVLILQGCTTIRPAGRLEVGDRVHVLHRDERRFDLRVTALGDDYIEGTAGRTEMRIALADAEQIDQRVPAHGKTVALVAGSIVGGLVVLNAIWRFALRNAAFPP
jgi:hypothetical protein